jgi:hypothetical protein
MSPMGQGLPKGPPDQRQRPGFQRKISAHSQGSQPLGGKHCWSVRHGRLSGGLEQSGLQSTGPLGAYDLNKNRGPCH